MSAFEIIDKDEFEKASGTSSPGDSQLDGVGRVLDVPEGQLHLEWCEFCKGWYIAEYHVQEVTK